VQVAFWRMHLFTIVQVLCLVITYMVKYFPHSSLFFPLAIAVLAAFRQLVAPHIFSRVELDAVCHRESASL